MLVAPFKIGNASGRQRRLWPDEVIVILVEAFL